MDDGRRGSKPSAPSNVIQFICSRAHVGWRKGLGVIRRGMDSVAFKANIDHLAKFLEHRTQKGIDGYF